VIKAKRVASKRSVFTWAHRRLDKGSQLTRHHKEQKRSTSGKAASVSGLNPTFGYPHPKNTFQVLGLGLAPHNADWSHLAHECAIFTGLISFTSVQYSLASFASRMHRAH